MWDDQILRETSASGNEVYVLDNKISLYPTRSDYELFYCCNDYAQEKNPDKTSRQAKKRTTRHNFPSITYTPATSLPIMLPRQVGAWPRDGMDKRLVQPIQNNRIDIANINTNPARDALIPAYLGSPPAPPTDRDNDGMPDAWEIARGLNPNLSNHNGYNLSSRGYTNLEVYLHELSTKILGVGFPRNNL
jgi:hypothetical protein